MVIAAACVLGLTACGHDARPATPRALVLTRAGGFAFARPPLVVVAPTGGLPHFDVYIRLNRTPPTGANRGYGTLDGLRAPGGLVGFVGHVRTCVMVSLNATRVAPDLRHARVGTPVSFLLQLRGVARPLAAVVRVTAPLRARGVAADAGRPYADALGCRR